LLPNENTSEIDQGIGQSVDATKSAFSSTAAINDSDRRLTLLYELTLEFGQELQPEALLQVIVERAVDVIPDAKRGALLINDPKSGKLLRAASKPRDNPALSTTLAQRAVERNEAFIWSRPSESAEDQEAESQAIPGSAVEFNIESAIYAPLIWKGKALGVVCVDNNETSGAFRGDDLQLLQALGHLAATAVAHLEIEKALDHESKVLANFLKLVSPQLAERLTNYEGPIRLGGEFREATILFSDIRGFAKLSSQMEPEAVGEMIENYFSRLVPIIFKHEGMVDKFVGDAIVAVFGSPKKDESQHRHAIQTALEMQAAMREVNIDRKGRGKVTGELGIGIHCGEVVHGFIGSRERMEFTVIGDSVNLASRYCDGAAGGEVLISPEVFKWAWKTVTVEEIAIETKHEGRLTAYSVRSLKTK
jgi:adenylate cyclase